MKNLFHEKWMRRALELAGRGRIGTSPNPMVGACIVSNGRKVGEGYHQKYGGEHAEIHALKAAGFKAKGASLYVTLEPCSTWGKTPPCAAAILRAGIRNVVIGALDPNPQNHGKGIQALKKGGIGVASGILESEIRRQNEAFFKYTRTGMPFVTLKMAQSLDGKIAARTGLSRWITSKPAREFVHFLRAEQDAILIGKNTLFMDNPALLSCVKTKNADTLKPWRIALDPDFEVSPNARIFKSAPLTFLAVSESRHSRKFLPHRGPLGSGIHKFADLPVGRQKHSGMPKGVVILPLKEKRGRLALRDLLKKLGALGVAKLLVEGGGELAWSLLSENLVDKACWIVAPKFIGGREAKTSVEGIGFETPEQAIRLHINKVSQLGKDWLFEGRV